VWARHALLGVHMTSALAPRLGKLHLLSRNHNAEMIAAALRSFPFRLGKR